MHPRERIKYEPIEGRPPLKGLPAGTKVVLWPILALEEWDIARPMARMVISPPQGIPQQPDHPNWSWHEYGMRVGVWRLMKVFKHLCVTPCVTMNAKICETYPQVVEACMKNGWELNAHSYDQQPMHKLENQKEVVDKACDIIQKFSGKRPVGWFGPGLTQTFDTLDYLSQSGIEYIGDWVLDDEPVWLKTKHKPVAAFPYNFEVHDIVMMALQHHPSEVQYTRGMDYFRTMYDESEERPKFMSVAFHPYLSGSPHRIRHVAQMLEEILSHKGVVCWDGLRILDWFKKSHPAQAYSTLVSPSENLPS